MGLEGASYNPRLFEIEGFASSKLCNQVPSLDHFVVQNSGFFLLKIYIVGMYSQTRPVRPLSQLNFQMP